MIDKTAYSEHFIKQDKWTDKEDNVRKAVFIQAREIFFAGHRKAEATHTATSSQAPPPEEFDDDIPF